MAKLPNDIYAERAVLGAMLIAQDAVVTSLGSLEKEDFYEGNIENRIVFEAMERLNDANTLVDVGTVFNELINMQKLESVGGLEFLEQLSENAIGLTGLEHYIKMIKDASILRNLLLACDNIKEKYNKGIEGTVSDFIAVSGDQIASIVEQRRVSDFIRLDEYLNRVNKDFKIIREASEDSLVGISTGYSPLNKLTNGWQKENMIILAARPSVGKTALALNFALTAAKKTKKTIAFFSLEMSGDLLTKRLLAMESEVNLNNIMTGKLFAADKIKIQEASTILSKLKIYIDDTPSIKMNDLLSKARKLQNNCNDLGFIIIDYIGLITSSSKSESRQIEVSEYSRKLKQLARTLKVPILVLCQLSRAVDSRDNGEPIMSDLRESGAIEQDADLIMLLSNQTAKKGEKKKDKNPQKDVAEQVIQTPTDKAIIKVDLAKNRNGQTGPVYLLFQKRFSKFFDITPENQAEFAELASGTSLEKVFKKQDE